ncbi:hypothetical protein GUJ93_ZPchr0009g2286 [Zizania palustris]|uniref:Ubiquitin-like domain-containing protein n=1 Tax=Zizania palustris TaxID=103762 RepID=A0A8J5RJP1_ZIZPA|nr:hypothetical protein GUJ93_ZPchr0009g2286 [Zizania palustris]
MRAKAKGTFPAPVAMKGSSPPAAVKEDEWEVRPGGMLVQKRTPDSDAPAAPVLTIRVKVKFNGVYHEIYINSQASFGELKKLLSAPTGLHPEEQKLVYKDKERDSKAFLDMAGVKDRSKIVLLEDPAAQAKRLLEQRRTDKAERAAMSISRISLDVDKLATKVTAMEAIVGKGGKVVDADVVTLTEGLMNKLVKLDAIIAYDEVKVQRRMQKLNFDAAPTSGAGEGVQKYVESLDAIRAKKRRRTWPTATASPRPGAAPPAAPAACRSGGSSSRRRRHPPPLAKAAGAAPPPAPPPTANWETFDLLSSMPSTSSSTVTTTMAAATATTSPPIPRFDWELF